MNPANGGRPSNDIRVSIIRVLRFGSFVHDVMKDILLFLEV